MAKLVLVESPAKARTLAQILGKGYSVKATLGHVRDLPSWRLGVNVDKGFSPLYIIPKEKKEVVKGIKEAASKAQSVFLATDPDREGEAISWHLVEAAGLKDHKYQRVAFHEITAEAVKEAFRHPRSIDMKLVEAQQARRILDRLVGYKLSPFLWTRVQVGLSAGRVQSAALRIVVDRETEIEAFAPREYWTIETELEKGGHPPFRALLVSLANGTKLDIPQEAPARSVASDLERARYLVAGVKSKEATRQPPPPFITSSLQQEAYRKLGFAAKHTMALAQQLYEGLDIGGEGRVGLITYMRTDSPRVSPQALREVREYIQRKYGPDHLPDKPRQYRARGHAQEAHEAIRPTSILREPGKLHHHLKPEQLRLYDLIWKRMLASQMAPARYQVANADIEARGKKAYLLRATSTLLTFPGFTTLYVESRDEKEEPSQKLPPLKKGDKLRFLGAFPDQHFTQPPPRYNEATLIRALEEKGIGRPSTYAPILSTLRERGYVAKKDGKLDPQKLGRTVAGLLAEHFPQIVDLDFTARMEKELDQIAQGELGWQETLQEFYTPFAQTLKYELEKTAEKCPQCGNPLVVKRGRFGYFLACSGFPDCRYSQPLSQQAAEPEETGEKCPQCDRPMVIKRGRFGKFLACSGYPDCRQTRPYSKKLDIPCPKCGGELGEKETKKGRVFYGCLNYPKCKFASSRQPLGKCPRCGGLLVSYRKGMGQCLECKEKIKLEEPVPAGATGGSGA